MNCDIAGLWYAVDSYIFANMLEDISLLPATFICVCVWIEDFSRSVRLRFSTCFGFGDIVGDELPRLLGFTVSHMQFVHKFDLYAVLKKYDTVLAPMQQLPLALFGQLVLRFHASFS